MKRTGSRHHIDTAEDKEPKRIEDECPHGHAQMVVCQFDVLCQNHSVVPRKGPRQP